MNICQKCFDDMHMVREGNTLKFVCDSHCGYEDTDWKLIDQPAAERKGGDTVKR